MNKNFILSGLAATIVNLLLNAVANFFLLIHVHKALYFIGTIADVLYK